MASNVSIPPEIDEIELPTAVAEAFRQAGDCDERPETLQDGFAVIQAALDEDDVRIELDDMYQSAPTRHAVHIDGAVEYVPCVIDAMIVAFELDTRPIDIYSTPPNSDETVQFRVDDAAVTVTPERAVASFGIGLEEAAEADLETVKTRLTDSSTIPVTCTVINAFPNSAAYERWADTVSRAAVMALSIEELVAISRQAPAV